MKLSRNEKLHMSQSIRFYQLIGKYVLNTIGFDQITLNWFTRYLSNR